MQWIAWLRAADIELLLRLSGLEHPWLIVLGNVVFSELLLACLVIGPLLLLLWRRGTPAAYWLAVYIVLKATVWSLKYAVGRPRPAELLDIDSSLLLYPQNPSFPSGVAADLAFIAFLLGLLWPRYRVPFALAGFLLAFLRVTAAAHYPTDVIAGALLGWLCAILGGWALRGLPQRRGG